MSATEGNRARLDTDTWRRIGAVLDRLGDVDVRTQPEALAEACRAEGLRVKDVEPFLAARLQSDGFLDHPR